MNNILTVTDAACSYIKKMLQKEQGIALRLTVKKTGCSGYSYVPKIINEVVANDILIKAADGIDIYIDVMWHHVLEGLHIDYVEDGQMGIKQKRLTFTNPKETSRCGCGESFHIEKLDDKGL